MTNQKRILLAVFVALLLFACQPSASLAGEKDADESKDEIGYVKFEKVHVRGEVKPDKALVYFLRPTSMGAAIKSFVMCDDEIIGINRGKSYFFAQIEPGKRVLWAKSENVDALELDLQPGVTYYVRNSPQTGVFKARTKLDLLSDQDGLKALEKCKKFGELTEAGRQKGAEIVKLYKENTQKDLERRAKDEAKHEEKEKKKDKKKDKK